MTAPHETYWLMSLIKFCWYNPPLWNNDKPSPQLAQSFKLIVFWRWFFGWFFLCHFELILSWMFLRWWCCPGWRWLCCPGWWSRFGEEDAPVWGIWNIILLYLKYYIIISEILLWSFIFRFSLLNTCLNSRSWKLQAASLFFRENVLFHENCRLKDEAAE